jgi:hypothetical protein
MPMPFKRTAETDGVQEETAEPQTCYAFRFRAYWFVLAQTEGDDTPVPPIPGFDIDTALCSLNITRTPFDELNGNIQGFAHGREIAVNPVAALPHKTTFHEIAHIVLGHTASEKLVDSEQTARHLREVEAESVALICCETLGLEGADFCRGYIQHWLKTEKEIPNQSAARIFAAATSISEGGNARSGQPLGCPFSVCESLTSLRSGRLNVATLEPEGPPPKRGLSGRSLSRLEFESANLTHIPCL